MSLLGTTLGHIRVVDVLGSGGMGEVYVGFDEKLKRRVALKAIHQRFRVDADARARFLREARVLSQLDHPNICRIHDFVESADGDFLVLELVEGTSLKQALRDGVTPVGAMHLAGQIASVLELAHEKGIVHRDLKPANVMITGSGDVKVLDFGLARLCSEEEAPTVDVDASSAAPDGRSLLAASTGSVAAPRTTHGSLLGTLQYMSPEQARGEPVSTASDIFSFGLLLQELFTGRPAHPRDLAPEALLERARLADTEPVTGVDRDLAELVDRMKSLAPGARPSAREVSGRLRWIATKPARRLKRLLAAAGAAGLLGLTAAYTLNLRTERSRAVVASKQAEQARVEAEAARSESDKVIDLLVGLFQTSNPETARGANLTAREILDRGASQLDEKLADQPGVHARLATTVARVYEALGVYDRATDLAEDALRIQRQLHGEQSVEVAECTHQLGDLRRKEGRFQEAEPLLRHALELYEACPQVARSDLIPPLNTLAVLYENWGRYEDASSLYRRALEILDGEPDNNEVRRSMVLSNLAILLARQGHAVEAEGMFRKVLEIDERVFGPDHPQVAVDLSSLGISLKLQGRYEEAEPFYRRALQIQERVLPADHPSLGRTVQNLANLDLQRGRPDAAAPLYQRALSMLEHSLGPNHPEVGRLLRNLALCKARQGDVGAAEALVRRSLAISEASVGPRSPNTATCLVDLAKLLDETGRLAEAESLARRGLGIQEELLGGDSPLLVPALHVLANTCRDQHRPAEAAPLYKRAMALAEANPTADPEELELLRADARRAESSGSSGKTRSSG